MERQVSNINQLSSACPLPISVQKHVAQSVPTIQTSHLKDRTERGSSKKVTKSEQDCTSGLEITTSLIRGSKNYSLTEAAQRAQETNTQQWLYNKDSNRCSCTQEYDGHGKVAFGPTGMLHNVGNEARMSCYIGVPQITSHYQVANRACVHCTQEVICLSLDEDAFTLHPASRTNCSPKTTKEHQPEPTTPLRIRL
eukprot:4395628-Amphidinium_carterae.1